MELLRVFCLKKFNLVALFRRGGGGMRIETESQFGDYPSRHSLFESLLCLVLINTSLYLEDNINLTGESDMPTNNPSDI